MYREEASVTGLHTGSTRPQTLYRARGVMSPYGNVY